MNPISESNEQSTALELLASRLNTKSLDSRPGYDEVAGVCLREAEQMIPRAWQPLQVASLRERNATLQEDGFFFAAIAHWPAAAQAGSGGLRSPAVSLAFHDVVRIQWIQGRSATQTAGS